MTPAPMPEPEGPEDERFVYAGVEALRQSAVAVDSEREAPLAADRIACKATRSDAQI